MSPERRSITSGRHLYLWFTVVLEWSLDYLLFALSPIIVGWPLLANILFVFYWVVTSILSLFLSKRITRRSRLARWKIAILVFLLLNIPPAAVPLSTFVQWGAMCLVQDDYVVHSTFDTPVEFLDEDGFPIFLNRYGNEFRLPMNDLNLDIVSDSSKVSGIISKYNLIVIVISSGEKVFELNRLGYHPSRYPYISYIYKEIPPRSCGYGSVVQDRNYYINIMNSVFTK